MEIDLERPNYYAIIPASVRYDNNLSAQDKLLYSEITALSTKDGYCWATNTYFAQLYNLAEETISRAISKLVKYNHIKRELVYKDNSKEIKERRLYPLTKMSIPLDENVNTPIDENVKDNNTRVNNTSVNKKEKYIKKKKEFIPPTLEEVKAYCKERNNNVDAKKFFDSYTASNWIKSNGQPVLNWKQTMINNWEGKNYNTSSKPQHESKPIYECVNPEAINMSYSDEDWEAQQVWTI